jgi:hypothetical protein
MPEKKAETYQQQGGSEASTREVVELLKIILTDVRSQVTVPQFQPEAEEALGQCQALLDALTLAPPK